MTSHATVLLHVLSLLPVEKREEEEEKEGEREEVEEWCLVGVEVVLM